MFMVGQNFSGSWGYYIVVSKFEIFFLVLNNCLFIRSWEKKSWVNVTPEAIGPPQIMIIPK